MSETQATTAPTATTAPKTSPQTSPQPALSLSPASQTPLPEARPAGSKESQPSPAGGGDPAGMIAGKFRSVAELEKAYKSLESQFHSRSQPVEVDTVLERAGLRADEVQANWSAHGRLTDEQYGAFAKAGVGRTMVDQFLTGQTALHATKQQAAQSVVAKAMEAVGGVDAWGSLTQWARTHYPAEKISDFDARLNNPQTTESAIKELLYDYRVVSGRDMQTAMIHGAAPPTTSAAFGSIEEVADAMRRIERQGNRVDEATLRRVRATPMHLFRGVVK